jgi:hypothetical protein
MADQEFRIKKGLRVQDALVINDQGNIAHADRLPEIPISKIANLQQSLSSIEQSVTAISNTAATASSGLEAKANATHTHAISDVTGLQTALNAKVDEVEGKGLSTEDYTSTEKSKLAGIEAGAEVNTVDSVAGKTGAVVLAKADVGLGNVDNTSDLNKPISTATQTALDLKAPLASPSLSGVPTAPTANAGTNTTQLATTAFVQTAVSGLVDTAPETLDTLNELAAALGDDPNFATTVSNQIGAKLDSSAYTASDVLTKIKTVDGAASGLDADLLDGQHANAFAAASHSHAISDVTGLQTALDGKAPLTGTGASGTWGISITGNAGTATTATTANNATNLGENAASYYDHRAYTSASNYLGGHYTSGGTEKPNSSTFGAGKLKLAMLGSGNLGFGGVWNDVLWLSGYTGGDVKGSYAIVCDKYSDEIWFSRQNFDSASWGTGRRLLHSGNHTEFSPTLTGTGASGTWGINITGNAGSASTASTLSNNSTISGLNFGGVFALAGSGATTGNSTGARLSESYGPLWDCSDSATWHHQVINGSMLCGFLAAGTNWGSGKVVCNSDMRAPIFYDYNDTAFYVDPASTSNLNRTSTYIAAKDTNGNWNTGFQNTPVSSYNFHGDISSGGPAGTWWFYESMRHSNASNFWGTQIAWGWEDNANRLMQRNVTGNSFSGWVEYLNTSGRTFAGDLTMGSSHRAPIFYDSNDTAYYCDPAERSNFVAVRTGASGQYNHFLSWTDLQGHHGLYSSVHNGAHFFPNNGSYGSWRIDGSRNGWAGIEFGSPLSNGAVSLMVNPSSAETGFHNNTAGWQLYFSNGGAYAGTGTYGGSATRLLQQDIWIGNKYFGSDGAIHGTIFYDANNSGYYVDPSSTGDSIRCAGNIVAYYSDERLKDIQQNIPNAVDKVKSLDGFYYKPNKTAQQFGYKEKLEVGVSAQAVEAVLPEIVTDAAIGHGYKTVDYTRLVPLLIEAIKEQQTQIEALTSEINTLKEMIKLA